MLRVKELGPGHLAAVGHLSSLDDGSRARDASRALELLVERLALCLRLTGSSLRSLVGRNASKEINTALGRLHVLHANVHTLLLNAAVDNLVDHDANRSVGDVEHDAGTAVVELVWHTLLDGGVDLDVNVVSDLSADPGHT